MKRAVLVGGPLHEQVVTGIPDIIEVLDPPVSLGIRVAGRYLRTEIFQYEGPEPLKPDRWARRKRPNPFTTPRT